MRRFRSFSPLAAGSLRGRCPCPPGLRSLRSLRAAYAACHDGRSASWSRFAPSPFADAHGIEEKEGEGFVFGAKDGPTTAWGYQGGDLGQNTPHGAKNRLADELTFVSIPTDHNALDRGFALGKVSACLARSFERSLVAVAWA